MVSNASGDFVLTAAADDTTITGFTLTGASDSGESGVDSFAGSSGLQLTRNLIQNNGNGLRLANPDGSHPALVSTNNFVDNSANYATYGDNQGTGIFICCGPADSTRVADNAFRGHLETAINLAGDGSNPSTNLVVSTNRSTDDRGHGTGILDYGANTNLRITGNRLTATSPVSQSSGISVSNIGGTSTDTSVTSNTITGYYNDLKIVSDSTSASAVGNKLNGAVNDGIIVQPGVSGALLSRNVVTGAGHYSCEDQTTGSGTAGTANTWTRNRGTTASSPAGICQVTTR